MIQAHSITAAQKAQMVSHLIAHEGEYGEVTRLSQSQGVSRQSLYKWKGQGKQALEHLFASGSFSQQPVDIHRSILTLLIECHGSYRGLQTSLQELSGQKISLGTISAIVQEAGKRAQDCLQKQILGKGYVLAIDEQYSDGRGEAYLNVVEAQSSLVLATMPPVKVDGESWEIVFLYLQDQGIDVSQTVSDGGKAIHEALGQIQQLNHHQRDIWHILHAAGKSIKRMERLEEAEKEARIMIDRHEKLFKENGNKKAGRRPRRTGSEQETFLRQIYWVNEASRYLFEEFHQLIEIVVIRDLSSPSLLSYQQRYEEVETVFLLFDELVQTAPEAMKRDIQFITKHIRLAGSALLHFAECLENGQQQTIAILGEKAVGLIAWAWQRRDILGKDPKKLLELLPPAWRDASFLLFQMWNNAVRASSAVENWHSIVRPHLAVHRRLGAGMLALLAVWHNHRIAPRGPHDGLSPLQRSGCQTAPRDWLEVLGYPAAA